MRSHPIRLGYTLRVSVQFCLKQSILAQRLVTNMFVLYTPLLVRRIKLIMPKSTAGQSTNESWLDRTRRFSHPLGKPDFQLPVALSPPVIGRQPDKIYCHKLFIILIIFILFIYTIFKEGAQLANG